MVIVNPVNRFDKETWFLIQKLVRTVDFIIVLHKEERVVVDVAEEVDAGSRFWFDKGVYGKARFGNLLDSPVILDVFEELMTEEELSAH